MRQRLESRTNERVKAVVRLREQSGLREQKRLFFAEGLRLCCDLAQRLTLRELYITDEMQTAAQSLTQCAQQIYEISHGVAQRLADTKTPQGVFAVFEQPCPVQGLRHAGRYLAVENMQNPANLGALMRSAAAFAYDGLLLCGACTDPFSPKALRAGMGAAAHLSVHRFAQVQQMAEALCNAKIVLYAAALQEAVPFSKIQPMPEQGAAVLVGNEANGLTAQALACAAHIVKIPIAQQVESLNAAAAGSILLWHFRDPKELV